jgi:hypothetical protein
MQQHKVAQADSKTETPAEQKKVLLYTGCDKSARKINTHKLHDSYSSVNAGQKFQI